MGKNILGIDKENLDNIYSLTRLIVYNDNKKYLKGIITNDLSEERLIKWINKFGQIGIKFNSILLSFRDQELEKLYEYLKSYYGYGDDFENTIFYESLKYVKETDELVLALHQLIHYITSYWIPYIETGQVKYINHEGVYIPPKKLKDKENLIYDNIDYDFKRELYVISLSDFKEFFINQFLYKNRIYRPEEIVLIYNITKFLGIDVNLTDIKNRELQVYLFKHYDKIKYDDITPDFALRLIIYNLTGETLVINSKRFRRTLKLSEINDHNIIEILNVFTNNEEKQRKFIQYFKQKSKLWKIIHRKIEEYKKRTNIKNTKDIDNVIKLFYKARYDKKIKTKEADLYNYIKQNNGKLPEKLDSHWLLQNYTKLYNIYKQNKLDVNHLIDKLNNILNNNKMDLLYVIKLYNSLKHRLYSNENYPLFTIRNNKKFVRLDEQFKHNYYNLDDKFVFNSIKLLDTYIFNYIKNKFSNQFNKNEKYLILLDQSISGFKLPTTNREIIDNSIPPYGSHFKITDKIPNSFIIGIHWKNRKEKSKQIRVDLDLSCSIHVIKNGEIIDLGIVSWFNTKRYISPEFEVIFSGDMTDAPLPNGATELILVNIKNIDNYDDIIINFDVRDYSVNGVDNARLILIPISQEHIDNLFDEDLNAYAMINLNNSIMNVKFKMDGKINNINVGLFSLKTKKFICGTKVKTKSNIYTKDGKNIPIHKYQILDLLSKSETKMSIYDWLTRFSVLFDNVELMATSDINKLYNNVKDNYNEENIKIINYNNFNMEMFLKEWR